MELVFHSYVTIRTRCGASSDTTRVNTGVQLKPATTCTQQEWKPSLRLIGGKVEGVVISNSRTSCVRVYIIPRPLSPVVYASLRNVNLRVRVFSSKFR